MIINGNEYGDLVIARVISTDGDNPIVLAQDVWDDSSNRSLADILANLGGQQGNLYWE